MRNLIKNILKESDELDWIREVPLHVPFEQAVEGKTYRIETTEVLRDAIEACDGLEWPYKSREAKVITKSRHKYNAVFCDHEREDEVATLKLRFKKRDYFIHTTFWVTEDMVTLYEIV